MLAEVTQSLWHERVDVAYLIRGREGLAPAQTWAIIGGIGTFAERLVKSPDILCDVGDKLSILRLLVELGDMYLFWTLQ